MGLGAKVLKLVQLAGVRFVAAAALLFVVGGLAAALSGADFSLSRLLFGYVVLMLANLSINCANDVFDAAADGYGSPSLISGGSGVLVTHPELRGLVRRAALLLMVLSLLTACLFVLVYAYPASFLLYILVGTLLGWFYSAPPLSLARRGLGEVTTTLTLGCLIPGLGYLVVNGSLTRDFLLLTPFLTLYGLAFIILVEIPDVEADGQAGKWTLVLRRGRAFAFRLTAVLHGLATVYFFGLAATMGAGSGVRFGVVGLLSLAPLSQAVLSAVQPPRERDPATRSATRVLLSLVLFLLAVDVQLAWLAFGGG